MKLSEQKKTARNINLNQIGFYPGARKTCVVRCQGIDRDFSIVNSDGAAVYTGLLSESIRAEAADEMVMQGDFSDFEIPGTYTIKVSNGEESFPFVIGENVYDDLLKALLKMLTLQRCGMELTSDIADDVAHVACHTSEAVIYGSDIKKEVNGGWHDAGDFGRYVVPGATTIADLLLTYEEYPDMWFKDDLNIPESGNGIPDILDEAKYELDWMIKMQDELSGGVYHKVSCKRFPPFVMPEEETDELVLSPISNAATADFAAIMAKASIVYREIDVEFSKKALDSAKKAYIYIENNMNAPSFKNPEDIVTGEYGDADYTDEIYWAAVELYKVTGEEKYKAFIEKYLEEHVTHGFGWDDVGSYGNLAYLSLEKEKQNSKYTSKIIEGISNIADTCLANRNEDGYMVSLGDNYCWGSNLIVCTNARLLMLAAKYNKEKADEYMAAAYDQLSYLLGQNPVGYCFVSCYGSLYPEYGHHRIGAARKIVIPGMVAGGPNKGLQDDCARKALVGMPPAKCYIDEIDSYSTNEVTIYWNSPLIYVLSAIINQIK